MRGKGCQITSLTSALAVSNYPERTVSEVPAPIDAYKGYFHRMIYMISYLWYIYQALNIYYTRYLIIICKCIVNIGYSCNLL